ncbi:high mobility group protein Z [Serratia marcescens]|nr:high mobility group protein Z [Serratia marcescens]ASM33413.1 high mobility group protein Z [Serratia marcescens]QDI16177.1 high mobility group protein Z [Serratia marcescens]QDI25919.1 high mobility group protein Z [Serratia marcescens]QDI35447.1 high mobility group protein Z [Serratia marcescens]
MWLIPIIALLLMCYLLWLFGKLWRLSKRKARFRSASVARQRRQPPLSRPGRKRYRKE